MKKRYSAFVSSVYTSLLDEREQVIRCLLNQQWIPICMEYFTLSAGDNFSALQDLIDDSDIVVLLLGREYGSVAEDGISWTEKAQGRIVRQLSNYNCNVGRCGNCYYCNDHITNY